EVGPSTAVSPDELRQSRLLSERETRAFDTRANRRHTRDITRDQTMRETKKTPRDMTRIRNFYWALTVAATPRAMFFSHTLHHILKISAHAARL
ncbi:MAG: hypothetical protein DMF97_21785, partial [Acidobacteria bacterium]